jgi:hypothetical protein
MSDTIQYNIMSETKVYIKMFDPLLQQVGIW